MSLRLLIFAGALLASASCAPQGDAPWLVDVTERLGPDFRHDCGEERTYFLPELMGPGCAWLDHDGDGDLDAYFVNAGPPPGEERGPLPGNRLFRQEDDGRFVEVEGGAGLADPGYGQGVAVGDYDNDGHVDVYVANYGANRLFHNRGDGTFEDHTAAAGVGDRSWSSAVSFCDFDADGFLDLYVANYLLYYAKECPSPTGRPDFCGPQGFEGSPDGLYRNRGDGTFEDVSTATGIDAVAMKGLGVLCADYSGDGRADFYVANDQEPNLLWVQRDDGTFEDQAVLLGAAFNDEGASEASMGLVQADLDGDLRDEVYVTHLRGQSNTAYAYEERSRSFRDVTAALGLHAPTVRFTGFGAVAADVEHDGDLDLLVANGHVFRAEPEPGAARGEFWNDYAQPGLLLLNEGGRFRPAAKEAGAFGSVPEVGRCLAAGDPDDDGDIDFLLGVTDAAAHLFFNEAPKAGHWIGFRVFDAALRRDVYGARVSVRTADTERRRTSVPQSSYYSSHDPRLHFGLGSADEVEEIVVEWPDGTRESFGPREVDRYHVLGRGEGAR